MEDSGAPLVPMTLWVDGYSVEAISMAGKIAEKLVETFTSYKYDVAEIPGVANHLHTWTTPPTESGIHTFLNTVQYQNAMNARGMLSIGVGGWISGLYRIAQTYDCLALFQRMMAFNSPDKIPPAHLIPYVLFQHTALWLTVSATLVYVIDWGDDAFSAFVDDFRTMLEVKTGNSNLIVKGASPVLEDAIPDILTLWPRTA